MKPSWGKTIGVFFLCDMIAITCCVIASHAAGSPLGLTGYSTGGLLLTVASVVCAAVYRKSGKIVGVALGSIAIGVIAGLLAVVLAMQFVAGQTEASAPSKSEESAVQTSSSVDYAAYCNTDEAKQIIGKGRQSKNWDDLKPVLQKVTFGFVDERKSGYGSNQSVYYKWALDLSANTMAQPTVHSEDAIRELEFVATAEMCGGPDERNAAYVGAHEYPSADEQIGKDTSSISGSHTVRLGERYYKIGDEWWASSICWHTAGGPKPDNWKGSWPEEDWYVLELYEVDEQDVKSSVNA